jgi:2-iminobutanoate/2-iminopropanoate deaminase
MNKENISTSKAPTPVGPYSQAVRAGSFLFISGQIPINPGTGKVEKTAFGDQVQQTLNNLKAIVEEGGSSLDKVVKVNVFLTDLGNFSEFNTIYAEYFGNSKPARACVQVSRLPLDVKVEVEAVALCG